MRKYQRCNKNNKFTERLNNCINDWLMLLGMRTGKSSTGNTLLGRGRVFDTRGGGASAAAGAVTAGHHLTVVDAQGWGTSEDFVPKEEKIELLRALSLCGTEGPHVVLLVIPLMDFTESERKAVERRMEIFTSAVWRHTMVLFTFGDLLKEKGCSVQEHIQTGGPALKWLMEKCHYRYHVLDNKAAQQQVRELLSKVEDMLEENGGWHFSFHMYQRLEEEWKRREQQLRALLEAQTEVGSARRKQKTLHWNQTLHQMLSAVTSSQADCVIYQ
uniref:Zgc:136870 n=1 Tax=Maylandia zebra TaxID=106582 RepID=A0A3P9B2T8_9CICH